MTDKEVERWRTIRAAMNGGWGPTLRYVLIRTVPTAVAAVGALVAFNLR